MLTTKDRITGFNCCEESIDNLQLFLVQLSGIVRDFSAAEIEVPLWLNEKMEEAKSELATRTRAEALRRLRELEARRSTYLSREAKLRQTEDEIESLKRKLNV